MCLISEASGDVERQPTARLPPLPLQPAARIPGLEIFKPAVARRDLRIGFGGRYHCLAVIIIVVILFLFFKPKGERHIHTKLWDLFNMILANAFCLFFFLGEYLQVASLWATRGCAHSVAHWNWACGGGIGGCEQGAAGDPGRARRAGSRGLGLPGGELPGRLWRRELCSGWLVARRTEKETSNIQTISARTPAPRARTHRHTHTLTCRP